MSRAASEWLAENLRLVRRARFTDASGQERPIGENGLALLVYLCDATNKVGVFFMQTRTMADEADLNLSAVKRLLAGFEQLGWVTRTGELISYEGRGRPTPEYALTLVPDLWKQATSTRSSSPPSHQTGSPRDTSTERKANTGKADSVSSISRTTTPTATQPPTTVSQVIARCMAQENLGNDRGGLREHLQAKYQEIVNRLVADYPEADQQTLTRMAVQLKRGEKVTTPAPKTNPDCPDCHGQGITRADSTYNDQGYLIAGEATPCHCTQAPTTKRVKAPAATNTDTPGTGATADPRSAVVTDLTQRFTRPA